MLSVEEMELRVQENKVPTVNKQSNAEERAALTEDGVLQRKLLRYQRENWCVSMQLKSRERIMQWI